MRIAFTVTHPRPGMRGHRRRGWLNARIFRCPRSREGRTRALMAEMRKKPFVAGIALLADETGWRWG